MNDYSWNILSYFLFILNACFWISLLIYHFSWHFLPSYNNTFSFGAIRTCQSLIYPHEIHVSAHEIEFFSSINSLQFFQNFLQFSSKEFSTFTLVSYIQGNLFSSNSCSSMNIFLCFQDILAKGSSSFYTPNIIFYLRIFLFSLHKNFPESLRRTTLFFLFWFI